MAGLYPIPEANLAKGVGRNSWDWGGFLPTGVISRSTYFQIYIHVHHRFCMYRRSLHSVKPATGRHHRHDGRQGTSHTHTDTHARERQETERRGTIILCAYLKKQPPKAL